MKSFSVSAGSPKNFVAALVFQHQKLALNGPDGRLGDVAVALRRLADRRQRIFFGIRTLLAGVGHDRIEQRAEILHVDQRQAVFVRDTECDIEDALLDVVQIEHPGQQQRPHFRDGGADRMALLAEHVPEHGRELVGLERQAHFAGPLDDEVLGLADFGDPGQVALDVGGEHRNAGARKPFRHHLQRHRLAGSGRAGDEAVPIGERERQPGRLLALSDKNLLVGIGRLVIGGRHHIASSRASGRFGRQTTQSYRILPVD